MPVGGIVKPLGLVFAVLLLAARPAWADEWSTGDRVLLGSALALTAIDWAQTRTVARYPERHFELNPILGPHPSEAQVNRYFGAVMVGTVGLALVLPPTYRRGFLGGVIIVEGFTTLRNHRLGIGLAF